MSIDATGQATLKKLDFTPSLPCETCTAEATIRALRVCRHCRYRDGWHLICKAHLVKELRSIAHGGYLCASCHARCITAEVTWTQI